MIFCYFRILQQSSRSIRQYRVQDFTFSRPSLLNDNTYAVSVREDGGFGVTEKRFNIEEEW